MSSTVWILIIIGLLIWGYCIMRGSKNGLVTVCAFGLFHLLFSTIHIFSRLPVIRIVDNILGVFGGFIEGAVILYLADGLLRYFVMV